MPVRDCMTGSPYCPANQESKFAMPGYEPIGCDACVEKSLNENEISKVLLLQAGKRRAIENERLYL